MGKALNTEHEIEVRSIYPQEIKYVQQLRFFIKVSTIQGAIQNTEYRFCELILPYRHCWLVCVHCFVSERLEKVWEETVHGCQKGKREKPKQEN